MSAPRIYLVGLRGTGKSTVGRILAERLGQPFCDADSELEVRAGRTIREIFDDDGEPSFRELEESILRDFSEQEPAVVATGGGVVLREANCRRMRDTGRVIWLTADVDTLWHRMQGDSTTAARRPDLGAGGREEIEQTRQLREALYRECADLTVDTAGRSPEQIVAAILEGCSTSSWSRVRSPLS